MVGCSAVNCRNNSNKGVRLFRFPQDAVRRKKWALNCRRGKWEPSSTSRLCIVHFEESEFENKRADNWKKLKSNAVPTLFNVPNPPPQILSKRKKGIGLPKPGSILDTAGKIVSEHQDQRETKYNVNVNDSFPYVVVASIVSNAVEISAQEELQEVLLNQSEKLLFTDAVDTSSIIAGGSDVNDSQMTDNHESITIDCPQSMNNPGEPNSPLSVPRRVEKKDNKKRNILDESHITRLVAANEKKEAAINKLVSEMRTANYLKEMEINMQKEQNLALNELKSQRIRIERERNSMMQKMFSLIIKKFDS